jgi:RND family efflux transporter MFP subunit
MICLREYVRALLFAFVVFCAWPLTGCGSSSNEVDQSTGELAPTTKSTVVLTVEPALNRSIGQTMSVLGRCEALPKRQALITPALEGRVTAILVEQGATVTAGQPIAQLDTTLAQADLAEKQAARDSLKASSQLLQSLPRSEEQATSRLAVRQAEVAVEVAQALVDRLRPLQTRKEIAESQLYDAEQALKQAELQRQAAQAQYDLLMLPPRKEAIDDANLKTKVAEEAVATARARVDLQTIRAPIDGVLDSLTCRLGQTITVGSAVGEIVDNREVMALVWVPVSRSQAIHPGQPTSVLRDNKLSADSGDGDATLDTGEVVYVGKVVDPQTGNIPVRIRFDNRAGDLVVGQTLAVDIEIESDSSKLCVPRDAIHDEGAGPAITVVRDGKAVVLHPQLGTMQDGWIPVDGTDLKAGEPVAVTGAYNLPDGTSVSVKTAGSSAPSAD